MDRTRTYAKRTGAHHSGDHETWDETATARPVVGGERATHSGQAGALMAQPMPRPGSVRRLTPTECCRLQGFPDWWLNIPAED